MKFTSEDLLKAMGLKVGQKVYVRKHIYEIIDAYGLYRDNGVSYESIPLYDIFNEKYEIIQPKPTLTEDEKVILRNLNKRYKYINREEYGGLRVSETKPIYSKSMKEYYYNGFDTFIYDNLFKFIKWEDEPYSIEELLKE